MGSSLNFFTPSVEAGVLDDEEDEDVPVCLPLSLPCILIDAVRPLEGFQGLSTVVLMYWAMVALAIDSNEFAGT